MLGAWSTESQLRSVGYMTFPHHLTDMNFHRSLSHAESARDHLVGFPQAEMIENLPLARCQIYRLTAEIISRANRPVAVIPMPVVLGFGLRIIGRAAARLIDVF